MSAEQDKVDAAFVARVQQVVDLAGGIAALSRKCQLSRAVIHKYLNGDSDPSRSRLIALARAGGVSVEWLATGADTGIAAPRPDTQPLPATSPHTPATIARRLAALFQELARPISADVIIEQAFAIHAELERSWQTPEEREKALDGIVAALRLVLGRATEIPAGDAAPPPRGEDGTEDEGAGFRQAVVTAVRSLACQPRSLAPLSKAHYGQVSAEIEERTLSAIWNNGDAGAATGTIRHAMPDIAADYEQWKKSLAVLSDTDRDGGCFGYFLLSLDSRQGDAVPTDLALCLLGHGEAFAIFDGALKKGTWGISNSKVLHVSINVVGGASAVNFLAACRKDNVFDVTVVFSGRVMAYGYGKSGVALLDDPALRDSEEVRKLDAALGAGGTLMNGCYIPNGTEVPAAPPSSRRKRG